jgi:2-methylisocitrate lyase-like PEP mutase family enzyme
MPGSGTRAALRRRLEDEGLVVAPGVFDMISARIADGLGFDSLYMTGYGISASHLGLPDAGFATLTDMVEGGRTPVLGAERLAEIGYRIAIYPATGFLAAAAALASVYGTLKRTGASRDAEAPLYDFDAFHRMIGFEEVWDFDRRYGAPES